MGGIQCRRREYKTYIDEPMGRCSTFNDISACTAPPAKMKSSLRARSIKPQQKRHKYDPTYSIWKRAFEDKRTRCPRVLLPIKKEYAASQNITDAVAGQRTPNGFPSSSELRETMRRKKATKRPDASDNNEVRTNSSEKIFVDLETPVTSTDQITEITENCFHTALPSTSDNLFSVDDDENNQERVLVWRRPAK